jgi:hypothetical protein
LGGKFFRNLKNPAKALLHSREKAIAVSENHASLALWLCFPSGSLFSLAFFRRSSTSHERAIQVGTPRRGSTQRISTTYPAKNAMNQNQSGITFTSFAAINIGAPLINHVNGTNKAFDHFFSLPLSVCWLPQRHSKNRSSRDP